LEKITTVYQTKRCLMQLSAACRWASKYGLIDANPFEGMANEMPKYRYQVEPKPNAFTEAEREEILAAFRSDKRKGMNYQHYAPFVEFLFLTGCRPSEAVGLQWQHIAEDYSKIHFTGSIATYKPIRIEGSKNNKKRWFPCSKRLSQLLQFLCPIDVEDEMPVFPSPKGKFINYNNFCNTAWKRIVQPIKSKTTPYSCRDTFITLQILKGTPVTAIAQWCDTSVEMIQKHYADHLKLLELKPID
jgi:integrase